MGIEIEMTGSGELGDIAPGWSVQEYATPVTIGDTAGGTGNVTFNAAARDTSLFVVNNNITTTEQDLGQISGVVKTVSQSGLNVSVTHNTPMALFDANFDIPALCAGGIVPAVDLCSQLVGRDKLCQPESGYFFSMRGHSSGFNYKAELSQPQINDVSLYIYNNNDGKYYTSYHREVYGTIWADSFTTVNNSIWATNVAGDTFSNNPALPVSRLWFKGLLSNSDIYFGFQAGLANSNYGSQTINLYMDYETATMSLLGDSRYNGIVYKFSQSTNLASSLDVDEEIAVFIDYKKPVIFGNPYILTISVCNTSDYNNVITVTQNIPTDTLLLIDRWVLTGTVRSIYRDRGTYTSPSVPQEYENTVTYSYTDVVDLNGAVALQSNANAWEYLQQACSAYNKELSIVDGAIDIRQLGINVLDIDNKTVPTITPSTTLSGRNVDIVYSNAQSFGYDELYNARNDNNRVLSVKASETITTTVEVAGTPTFVSLPYFSLDINGQIGEGEYFVCTTNGTPIPRDIWGNYGGKLEVFISETTPNAIDIKLTGPTSTDGVFNETPPVPPATSPTPAQYPGPYKVAYSSGGTDYAALSIVGSGIKTTTATLKLLTAADPNKVSQETAKTITNPFIVTEEQAYDRGINAAIDASGPRVSLSASIPVSAINSFGLVAGSLVRYRDSIYRINDVTIGNLVVSFNASRHVTVEDFDAVWAGKTVGMHDLMWLGFDASDHLIAPLRYIGDDESVLMFLDTDVNPYYDFNGEPEISVFQDTDTNPYYEEGGNLEGEDTIKLDTDANPYDEDL